MFELQSLHESTDYYFSLYVNKPTAMSDEQTLILLVMSYNYLVLHTALREWMSDGYVKIRNFVYK